jgi:hypothetical protein
MFSSLQTWGSHVGHFTTDVCISTWSSAVRFYVNGGFSLWGTRLSGL